MSTKVSLKNKSKFKKMNYKKKVQPSVKEYVNRQLHKQIEDKCCTIAGASYITSYTLDNNMATCSLIPTAALNQGVGQGARISNKITVTSLILRIAINSQPYDAIFNQTILPQNLIIWIGYLKQTPAIAPNNLNYATLFQAGNASGAPAGNVFDTLQPVNKDVFVIKKTIKYKLGFDDYGVNGLAAAQYYHNNDYKYNMLKVINLTKLLPKKVLNFNDSTQTPTNSGLYMWFDIVPANGTNQTSGRPALMNYTTTMYYEDA